MEKYVVIFCDGQVIRTTPFVFKEAAEKFLRKDFEKYLPEDGLTGECKDKSEINELGAIMYRNGKDILVWALIPTNPDCKTNESSILHCMYQNERTELSFAV